MTRILASWVMTGIFLGGLVSQALYAEQFMGVEEGSGSGASTSSSISPSETYNYDKGEAAPDPELTPRAEADPYRGKFYFSLGLSPGVGTFSGLFTVGYLINRYVVVDTTVNYTRYDRNDDSGEQYGPEVSLILRLPNPTIITPFIGAGSGYSRWAREEAGEQFDDGGSVTVLGFGGLNIKLTKNFGLQVKRKQTTYLADGPITWEDHEQREPKTTVATMFGFYAAF